MNGPAPPLSDLQIAAHAREAGFYGDNLVTMVAVSLAESGGDPDNVGDEHLVDRKWGPSYGLTMVRSLWEQLRTGGTRDASKLTNPRFNLRSAFEISSGGTNFRPWTQWVNREFEKFLPRARRAAAQLGQGGGGLQGLKGGLGVDPAGAAGGIVGRVVDPLLEGAGRIALVGVLIAGGVALVAAGGWRASQQRGPG